MINTAKKINNYPGFRYLISLFIAIFLHIILIFFSICFLLNRKIIKYTYNRNNLILLSYETDYSLDNDQNTHKRKNYQDDSITSKNYNRKISSYKTKNIYNYKYDEKLINNLLEKIIYRKNYTNTFDFLHYGQLFIKNIYQQPETEVLRNRIQINSLTKQQNRSIKSWYYPENYNDGNIDLNKNLFFNGENLYFYRSYNWLLDEKEKQNREKLEKKLIKNLDTEYTDYNNKKMSQSQLLMEIALNYEKMGNFDKAAEFYYYCLCLDNGKNKFSNFALKKYIANRNSLLYQIRNLLNQNKDYSLILFFTPIDYPDFSIQDIYKSDKKQYYYAGLLIERFIFLYPDDKIIPQLTQSLCYCYYKTDRIQKSLYLIQFIKEKINSKHIKYDFIKLDQIYRNILNGNQEPANLAKAALAF